MMMASNTNNIFTSSSIIVVIVVGVALLICTIVTEDGSTVHSFILQNTRGVLTKEKSIFIRECDRVVRYQNHGQHLYGGRRRHHQQQHRQDPHKHRNRWRKRMIPSSSYNSVLRESSIEYYDSLNDDIHETRSPKEEGTDDDLTVTMTMKTMMTSMTNFFSSMVDPSTNRFYYLYRYKHQSQQYIHRHQQQKNDEDHQQEDLDQFVHHHVPIRDLAASWDATKAIQFFYAKNDDEDDDDDVNIDATTETASITMQYRTERRLLDAIRTTLSSYHLLQSSSSSSSSSTDRSFIDTSDLADGETPNIGHSSMWVLGAIGWKRICDCQQRRKVQQETVLTRTDIKNRKFQSDVLSPFSTSIIDMNILRSNVSSLIEGILEQQNDNGSFRINFNLEDHRPNDKDGSRDDIQEGIEFFPGEAMLALMEVYHESSSPSLDREDRNKSLVDEKTCQSIRTAMTRAFDFYSSYYDQHKQRLGTNYNIWQIQAFSRFFLALNGNDLQNGDTINEMDGQHFMDRLYNYITTLCDDIVSSPAWKELNRGQSFYRNLQTLEIVCGLDALLDGLSVVEETTVKSSPTCDTGSSSTDDGNNNNVETEHKEDDEKIRLYRLHVMNAIDFLKWAQDQTINSNGGLGYGGLQVTEQRLDVTGHAISALSKAAKLTI